LVNWSEDLHAGLVTFLEELKQSKDRKLIARFFFCVHPYGSLIRHLVSGSFPGNAKGSFFCDGLALF